MSDLERLMTDASLLTMANDEPLNLKVEGSNSNLSINTKIKLAIHESLIQESGK